jgi:hypothetical protein
MKNRLPEILAGLAIIAALLLPLHQKLTNHFWFNWSGFLHHESVGGSFVALAIGLLLGKYLGKPRG